MEREPQQPIPTLVDVVAHDFPNASEVLVSFPDQWEFVTTLKPDERQLYIGAFPLERARPTRDHFYGLAPEVNVSLVFYRLYTFFEPWPMPIVTVDWNPHEGQGRVTGMRDLKLQLQPIGQAQAWFGLTDAVLWECYFQETRRRANWKETLAKVWETVERDLMVTKIFTAPHEPAFEEGYTDFLTRIGYALDSENPDWWSKQFIHPERMPPR